MLGTKIRVLCIGLAVAFVSQSGCWKSSPLVVGDPPDGAVVDNGEMARCEGGKLDLETGLCWQEPISKSHMDWQQAIEHCDYLDQGGHTNWELPTIDELRSLIRGCKATETGGLCPVTHKGGTWDGDEADICLGCDEGCHTDTALKDSCDVAFWSSTLDDRMMYVWVVDFFFGGISSIESNYLFRTRCVRIE